MAGRGVIHLYPQPHGKWRVVTEPASGVAFETTVNDGELQDTVARAKAILSAEAYSYAPSED